LINGIIPFIGNSCKIKHKGTKRYVNLIILVSGNDFQGPNGAEIALALCNEFCHSGVDIFVEEFIAVNWSLVECISYSKGLTIAIPSLPNVTDHFFIVFLNNTSKEHGFGLHSRIPKKYVIRVVESKFAPQSGW
jgi:hypothetical protein